MSNETRRNRAETVVDTKRAALQWANGRTQTRDARGRLAPLVGFHVEVGRSEAFDAYATERGLSQLQIKHMGKAEPTAHWDLGETLRVYPLTYGPVADTVRGAVRAAARMADEGGIVASWVERSYIGMLVLVEIDGAICEEPLVLSAKSTMTDHLLGAMLAHLAMCEAADAVAGRTVPCCWIALPLAAGVPFAAGRNETTEITPLRADYARDPINVDIDWLRAHSLPRDVRSFAEALAADSPAWAREVLAAQTEPQLAA